MKDHDVFIEKLFKKSQMRELELSGSGLSDEWAKKFARRVLPIPGFVKQMERRPIPDGDYPTWYGRAIDD